jgi:hypothetical protein
MMRTLNRWQHTLFSACFHLPEDMEPLKNHPWPNQPLQNRPLQNHPLPNRSLPDLHAEPHQPRVLKEWQNSIENFVERYTAQK